MPETSTRPLLSLAVIGFNQEPYIREAVEAAFAQTYSPLQIILSDDASGDRTFEVMRDLAAAYRGSHQIVLNRNSANLGLAGHMNRIMELARGELVMSAAGDDISLPNRAEMTWRAWEDSGRKAVALQSTTIDIDEKGTPLDPAVIRTVAGSKDSEWTQEPSIRNYVRTLSPGIVGSALAFSPSVFSAFGPLPGELIHEDNVIALRALCFGGIAFIPVALVKRRFHANNLYSRCYEVVATRDAVIQQEDRMVRDAENRRVMYQVFLADIQMAESLGLVARELWRDIKQECYRGLRLSTHQSRFVDAPIQQKVRILSAVRREEAERELIAWMLPRLIPRDLFRSLKTAGNTARLAFRRSRIPKPAPEKSRNREMEKSGC